MAGDEAKLEAATALSKKKKTSKDENVLKKIFSLLCRQKFSDTVRYSVSFDLFVDITPAWLRLRNTNTVSVPRVFFEQRIAVKQLALHIDTWYTSRGVGKEQAEQKLKQ